jgi:serine kinase of HPr protein (carbohydrate metabolism regulator)
MRPSCGDMTCALTVVVCAGQPWPMTGPPLNVHATCVAMPAAGTWTGVMLRGAPGAGKSDLALRLLDGGARLVADDRTDLTVEQGRLVARPPAILAGLIEARGIGILRLPADSLLPAAPVALVVDLVAAADIERMPAPQAETLLGVAVPRLSLAAFEASTPAKIRLALAAAAAS